MCGIGETRASNAATVMHRRQPSTAMRVQALIAIVMMFGCGVAWGRYAGSPRP